MKDEALNNLREAEDSNKTIKILKNILNGLDVMIYVTVPQTGEILFINDLMKNHYGLEDDCVGKLCYKILQKGKNERCDFCPCHELDKNPNKTVVWIEHNTLTNCVYRNKDSYIQWTDGKTVHMQHSFDITELDKSKERAIHANDAKSFFLSTVSHEMRIPINAIVGMAAIGNNAADIEDKIHALEKIEESSKHLQGIINNILDMSKIEANKLELSHITFDVNQAINKAVSSSQFSMNEKQLELFMNVSDNVPPLLIGDSFWLTQVLMNLLSNAVKHTPSKGCIRLDVSLSGEKDGICELHFEVADNGIGITSEKQETIFNAYEHAENSRTGKRESTGLGLFITKFIIELMNGKIWVKSEVGKGARFIFTVKLPRGFKEKEDIEPVLASMENSGIYDRKGILTKEIYNKFKGKNILIIDDSDVDLEIIFSLLDGSGINTDTAANGRDAVDMVIIAPDKYDLIFMDMQMPVMDGLEATRQIRAIHSVRKRKLPIIAMTANVFQEDIDKCNEAGMDDHIGKPIDFFILLEKLKKYLPDENPG